MDKPCEKQTKPELVDGTCKDLGLYHGLKGLKKPDLVDLCCNPDGIDNYLENAWKGYPSLQDNNLAGDAFMTLDKDKAISLLREKPDAPTKAFWGTITGKHGITKGNLFGNPAKCNVPIPDRLKQATTLKATGDDVFDHKDIIKNDLGGIYQPQLQAAWTWHLDDCGDVARKIDDQGILMGDVTIEPCTVLVYPFRDVKHVARRWLDPEPMQGMLAYKRERSDEEARERVSGYKDELKERFGLGDAEITEERIDELVSDPLTAKYFHEKLGAPMIWTCADEKRVMELIDDGKAMIVDRDLVPFDDEDVTPLYLEKQRNALPRVVFKP